MPNDGSLKAVIAAAYADAERLAGPVPSSDVSQDAQLVILSGAAATGWLKGASRNAYPMLFAALTHFGKHRRFAEPDPNPSDHRVEFPDFPVPELDASRWRDASWRNEACPRFIDDRKGLSLFTDHPDPEKRELGASPRFSLSAMSVSPDGWQHDDETYEVAASDDLVEMLNAATIFTRDVRNTAIMAANFDLKPWSLGGGIEGWGIRAGAYAITVATESGRADDDAYAPIWGVDWGTDENGGPLNVERNAELTFRQAARAARRAADEIVASSFDPKEFRNESAKW